MPMIAPYGTWSSPVTPELITAGLVRLSWPLAQGGRVYWCEGRPAEGGRVTLLCREAGGTVRELTPAPFNARTAVHEYGGRSFAVADGLVVVASHADQRLWRLDGDAEPVPLTPESEGALRYADMVIDAPHGRVLAVREDHRGGGEPVNELVAVPLEGGPQEGEVLARGHDFVAAPALSPDGRQLAWLSWDHPDMPWDATTLWVADLENGRPVTPRAVAGGAGESVVQPFWMPDGSLVFASDRNGWWNLHVLAGGEVRPVLREEAEHGGPLWQLGMSWTAPLDQHRVASCSLKAGFWRLSLVDLRDGSATPLPLEACELAEPSCDGGRIVLLAGYPDRPAEILAVDAASGAVEVVKRAGEVPLDPAWISRPEPLTFEGPGGIAHALYYAPRNPDHAAPEGELPPVIVRSHGGPTGRASGALTLSWQFWTSRGFAVVDVDYRGSSGYGRAYRKALEGAWGVADVEDCVAAAGHLVATGRADPERLVIAGSSAGGYTTLAALAFAGCFKAGASYYGIGDLRTLLADTHKFESRYLDRLVGPWPERADLYEARSPIAHPDRLSCPVIFFQGLDDKVVPPNQAEAMVEALEKKGIPVAYLAFAGEGHGFRKAATIQAVLEAELAFYCRIFGIAARGLAPLEIRGPAGGPEGG
ncbi:dipeptidyl-peptidase 5 [Marinimicrococcus flavescens]|uniref:S9 family peptidase n=1 Tax=Marinimicrococcus flavescens TaxID=3031815 RepID=A0AAP3UZ16_9PROT|nr:S9 family peptidase [Marinimicrococcus flavescens]